VRLHKYQVSIITEGTNKGYKHSLHILITFSFKGEGTPKKVTTATSHKHHQFEAGNWFPDSRAGRMATDVR
jgi:hypothetical protein